MAGLSCVHCELAPTILHAVDKPAQLEPHLIQHALFGSTETRWISVVRRTQANIHRTLVRVSDGELEHVEAEFYREHGSQLPIEAMATGAI